MADNFLRQAAVLLSDCCCTVSEFPGDIDGFDPPVVLLPLRD
jgi:hypothetical protein